MNNHLRFTDYVKSEFLQLELREILQSPPSVLMGVSPEAEEALKTLKIFTVFDLALSSIFQNAITIVDAHENVAGILAKYGQVPSDIVDSSAADTRIADLQNENIEALTGIGSGNGPQVETALIVKTIRDLARWPPYVAAKKLVDLAFNLEALPEFDPEAPADLLPTTGEFPTDKVSYRSIVMIDAPEEAENLVDLTANGPVDLVKKAATGFARPATGAILTYSQSWYPKAVTLGQLLYSLPLAPGESTKIALIDWTRRTSATTEEDIAQTENLSNTLVQSRAISEIAEAVAEEAQEGSSDATSRSRSRASGTAGPVSEPFDKVHRGMGLLGQVAISAGGASRNRTTAHTFTTSKGKRELSSEMQQNISSSTQQNAFSARNKRAAIISEATQQEREQISTRTVTNYNHMHALSVQYYEVVQLYQTIVRLEKCERCLYIPMKVLTFNEQAIARFRSILFDAALSSRIQELLVYATGSVTTNLELRAANQFESGLDADTKQTAKRAAFRNAKAQSKFRGNFQQLQIAGLIIANNDQNTQKSWEMAGAASYVGAYWSGNRVSRMIVKKGDGTQASLGQRTSAPPPPRVHKGLGVAQPISELSAIELEFSAAETDVLQDMTLVFRLNADPGQNLELKCDCILPAHQTTAVLLSFVAPMVTSELIDHLNENALYYSQEVWLRSDPSLLALQLAPFTFKNKRVIEYVDPAPVNAAANYLIFRWKDEEDQAWKDWVEENADKTRVEVDTVALPTGGVFAEAVLGRFNSAEKLDITRFWNWQDSPIPIQAPEIAALQAGQHTVTDQLAPGSLESPIVNIQTPPALPDPTGMQAILQTLAASNLFRDMSGITQAAALAQSGLQNASQGAVAGMNQAGANMATLANFAVETAKILASLAPMLLGLPPLPAPASKNITNAGAAINQGEKMDARQNNAGQAPNPPPFDLGGGGAGGPGGGGSSPGPTTVPDSSGTIFASTAGSMAGAAFDALIGRTVVGRGTTPAVTSTPVSPATPLPTTVAQAISDFRRRSGTSPFTLGPNSAAIREAFAMRLEALAGDPNKFDQSHVMGCGMAAFFRVWLERNRLAVVNYAINLFEHGRARIGSLQINPDQQLLKEDYAKLVADFGDRMPQTAEWIMMSSLRNATPGRMSVFSYLGRPAPWATDSEALQRRTQDVEGIVFPDELAMWLDATGEYSDVVNKANPVIRQDFSVSQNLFPDDKRDVVMLMNTQMINPGNPDRPCNLTTSELGKILLSLVVPNHYVVLERHIDPPVNGKVSLTFWCWADSFRGCMPYEIDLDTFKANFFGAVIAVK